jgi:Zn-dependent metalloprotease
MKKVFLYFFIAFNVSAFAQTSKNATDYVPLILSKSTGLKPFDLTEMKISSRSSDKLNGVTHIYFNQYYKSIPVHNAVLGLHLDKEGKIVALNSTFVKNLESFSANSSTSVTALEAARFALSNKTKDFKISPTSLVLETISTNTSEIIFKNSAVAKGEIKTKLKWVTLNGKLVLAWNVNWLTADEQNWWNVRVDAQTGQILDYDNWVAQCQLKGSHTLIIIKHLLFQVQRHCPRFRCKEVAMHLITYSPARWKVQVMVIEPF